MDKNFNPKISIIIPVYNGSNFMKKAIDSAINQTYENKEILIINDGSTDNGETEKIALSYGDKIRYIKKENGGVASALNLGIKEASGEYISWLSHDDNYKQNKLQKQVQIMSTLEDKDTILFSNVQLIDEHGDIFFTTDYSKGIGKEKLCQGIYPVIKGTVNGCSTLISKKCFEKVGVFNENLKTTNDYEMWIRLFGKFNSYLIEEPLIQYRVHKNQDTNKSPYFLEESNNLWTDIINSLSEEQIEAWDFEPFNVYMDLYFQMYNSKYDKAYPVAYNIAKSIYEKQAPKVSIIMPCYNSQSFIRQAIESVLAQTYRNFELLVINDSSQDNTEKIVKEYEKKDFRIKFINNEEQKGISGAMNTGIYHSKGIYITRMDSDDILEPTKIEKQVNFLDNNKEYGVCSVNIAMLDKLGNIYNENVYPEQSIPSEWTFLWTNPIPNAPCMYRADIIKENNLKFSKLKTAEDYDFLRKIIIKTKVYMINEPLYYYRYNESGTYNRNMTETFRNSLKISKKFYTEITKNSTPNYYDFLTFFYIDELEPVFVDINEVYDFLEDTAKKFKEFFNWNEEQYKNVNADIIRIIERYSVYKYLAREHGKIGVDFIEKPQIQQSSIGRLIHKCKDYIKANGIKKALKKIISKMKGKIWRK